MNRQVTIEEQESLALYLDEHHPELLRDVEDVAEVASDRGKEIPAVQQERLPSHEPSAPKRKRKSQGVRQNEARDKKRDGGARKFLTKPEHGQHGASNKQTCLRDAVVALTTGNLGDELLLLFDELMSEGDMSIETANVALERKGMSLVSTGRRFMRKGGLAFNLLQEHDCRLVVRVVLEDHEDNKFPHFVAFDGKDIADRPHSIRVNASFDRKTKEGNEAAFGKLFSKSDLKNWVITSIYELK